MADRMASITQSIGGETADYLLVSVITPISGSNFIGSFLPKNYDAMVVRETQKILATK